jgi:flagellar hook-basal body complex protein FliE
MDPLNLNALSSIKPLAETGKSGALSGETTADGANFSDLLKQALQEVNGTEHVAEQEARNLMTGGETDMHTAILAVQKADVSFQMMMAVRSKLISAYQEVMRMQM